jgi:hypothetical protein
MCSLPLRVLHLEVAWSEVENQIAVANEGKMIDV